jgi:hypothetical protein
LRFLLVLFAACFFCQAANGQTHTVTWEKGVYKKTTKKWINALNKSGGVSSTSYINKQLGGKDKLHAVKHRDSIVWIPNSTNLSEEFIMLIWFHGHWGYDEQRTFNDRTLKQIVPKSVEGKRFVLVLPEMPWTVHGRTPTKRNSKIWMRSGDFLAYIKSVEGILSEHNENKPLGKIDYRIVGHSAGGSTIKRLGMTGDLCDLNPSMVVWSDSSYGPWLKLAWDGCLNENPQTTVKVFVAHGDSPWLRATQFMGEFQDPPPNLQLFVKRKPKWSHKLIGHNIIKLSGVLD